MEEGYETKPGTAGFPRRKESRRINACGRRRDCLGPVGTKFAWHPGENGRLKPAPSPFTANALSQRGLFPEEIADAVGALRIDRWFMSGFVSFFVRIIPTKADVLSRCCCDKRMNPVKRIPAFWGFVHPSPGCANHFVTCLRPSQSAKGKELRRKIPAVQSGAYAVFCQWKIGRRWIAEFYK